MSRSYDYLSVTHKLWEEVNCTLDDGLEIQVADTLNVSALSKAMHSIVFQDLRILLTRRVHDYTLD